MAIERETLTINGSLTTNDQIRELVQAKDKAKLKALMVNVLDRNFQHDRMHVPLPKDVYGEWVNDDPMEVRRFQEMGYELDREYAKNKTLHDTGDGISRVGDVVFMTCPMIVREVYNEIRAEQLERINNPKRVEKQFDQDLKQHDPAQKVKSFEEKNAQESSIDKSGILAAINATTNTATHSTTGQ